MHNLTAYVLTLWTADPKKLSTETLLFMSADCNRRQLVYVLQTFCVHSVQFLNLLLHKKGKLEIDQRQIPYLEDKMTFL